VTLMRLLFSYGTLRDPAIQRRTFGREVRSVPDALEGYILGRVDEHANAVFSGNPGDVVHGVSMEVTEDELAAADEYERPFEYGRIAVTLVSGRNAWVYVSRRR
jgi:gamma-glutamylcyclotransferase (GGCT)/AIG2-like uncharacterized protein YtfP